MRGTLKLNKSDLSARIVKLSLNPSVMIKHYLNRTTSTYDEKKCSKHLILIIFNSEWTAIQIIQLILLIIFPTNLLILYIIVLFVNYLVAINTYRKMRIKILIKIDSLWINTYVNGNILNDGLKQCQELLKGFKSVSMKNFKLSNDTTSLIHNMIMTPKMFCNNNNNNLFLRLCICDYLIGILYKIYCRNNGMDCSVIKMVMRKRMRKKKIINNNNNNNSGGVMTILCARMNIVFIFLVIDKTDRHEFILIIYSMILILYIILNGIYQLMCQFMIENKAKHLNIIQENWIYIEKNIFGKNVIYLDVIIFSLIIILYGLYTMFFLEIMKCCIFLNCSNRKVRMRKRKRKCKGKNSSNNVMCKDEYFILFLVMDNTDRNGIAINIYSIVLILCTILHGIYQLNCQNMTENKAKDSNTSQDNLTYNKKIFEKIIIVFCVNHMAVFISIIMIVYDMNTLFNWFTWIKYRNNKSNINTKNKDSSKSDTNNITIECTQMHIFISVNQLKQIKRDNILNIKLFVNVKERSNKERK